MTPELEWIQAAKRGDEHALACLLRSYERPLLNYIYGFLHHQADAEDVLQTALVKICRALPRYEEKGFFKAWVYRIARNEALKHMRTREKRKLETSMELVGEPVDTESLGVSDRNEERRALLFQSIQQLPETEQEVVRMRIVDGLSFKEIAEIMECSINTALGRMHNATRRMQTYVKEAGGTA